jgi:serine protease Do
MRFQSALLTLALLGTAFAGGWVGVSVSSPTLAISAPSDLPPPTVEDKPTNPAPARFEALVGRIMPAVVSVDAVKPAVPGAAKNKPTEESGSGVLVQLPGYRGTFVITNNHVVAGAKAAEITVTLNDGRIIQPDLVRTDPESDIALLRVVADNLPTAELGDSDTAKSGQWVLAFGSPFGFSQTVTHGIISARDRGQISLGNTIRIKEFLQTDAAINPGNSGGPLVDTSGHVIGINTANASTNGYSSGVAFSIPINLVKRIGKQLLDQGTVSRGYVGMQMSSALDPHTALKLGLTRLRGALVESVHSTGPATRAGLQSGDVILKLDGLEIRDENHLINLVGMLPPHQKVKLTVWRNKQASTVELTVGEWPRGK